MPCDCGTGCPSCSGKGVYLCPKCNGEGTLICPACDGTSLRLSKEPKEKEGEINHGKN